MDWPTAFLIVCVTSIYAPLAVILILLGGAVVITWWEERK